MTATLIATIALTTPTALAHPRVTGITPAGVKLRAHVYRTDRCLAQIIDRETGGTWNERIYNGFGHWHPGEPMKRLSYGLPQSWPAEKMASAGADWRTNPFTQLRWMRGYTAARYGSSCAALSYWLRHRYY